MKKILLGLLTLILSFGVINKVFALEQGSIVINGTTKDKTYEIYKIFDLTYSGSKVAYTIDSDWEAFFENNGASYIVNENTNNLNAITIGDETKYINITDDNIEKFTKDALVYATTLAGNDGSEVALGETLTFDGLELGYYLVYPQGATDIINGNGSICSITSTLPTATVNIKADYPNIKKEVDDPNAFVGQLVEFTITGLVPDTTGYSTYTYEVADKMTAGLLFESISSEFAVKFGNTNIEVEPVYEDNGFTLTFDMVDYQEYVGEIITITYKAMVTEEAVNSDTTMNSATLTYSNNPKDTTTTTTTPIEIPVYSSEVKVIKVDGSDNEVRLAGATFVIKNADGLFYQAKDMDGKIITNTTTTENLKSVNWVEKESDATLLITTEEGIITFKGLENGTYYLVEIEAPEGYNKLDKPVMIKVGYTDEEGTNLGTVAVSHEEIVENNSGIKLPITGGIGTTLFMIIGSLLVITSTVLLVTNRKVSEGLE